MRKLLIIVFWACFALSVAIWAENTIDGTGAGLNLTAKGVDNTLIGSRTGQDLTIGQGNTILGAEAGRRGYGTKGAIKIGYLSGQADTTSHKLFITTGFYPAKGIFGAFNTGYFGINNTSPSSALDITGDVEVSGKFVGTTSSDSISVQNIKITGAAAKGIDFANKTPTFSDMDNAWIGMGTWNDGIDIRGQTEHFVPLQIHLDTRSNIAKDIAAARFRVDTDSTVTNQAVGNLQLRQNLGHALASSAILNASVTITDSVVVGTGSLLGGYFSIEGSGYIRKAGSNDCTPLVAVNNNTGAITVDNVFNAVQNGTGTTVGEIINVVATNGTATVGVNINESGGTITKDISLQNGETIDNATDGTIALTGSATVSGTLTAQATNTPVQLVLADSTLTAYRSGYTYIARPVAAKTTLTLPAATAGVNFSFFAADADTLRVTCAGTDSLIASDGTAWKTTTSVAGSFRVVASTGKWWIFPNAGTWTNY